MLEIGQQRQFLCSELSRSLGIPVHRVEEIKRVHSERVTDMVLFAILDMSAWSVAVLSRNEWLTADTIGRCHPLGANISDR